MSGLESETASTGATKKRLELREQCRELATGHIMASIRKKNEKQMGFPKVIPMKSPFSEVLKESFFKDAITNALNDPRYLILKTIEDRVQFVLQCLARYTLTSTIDSLDPIVVKKDPLKAAAYMNSGTHYFSNELNSHQSIIEYSKSVINFNPGTHVLTLAYISRSSVLLHCRIFKDCLMDIERAINNGVDSEMMIDLAVKKLVCMRALKPENHPDVVGALAQFQKYMDRIDPKKAKYLRSDVEKQKLNKTIFYTWDHERCVPILGKENPRVPGLSDAVDVRYSEKFGRHIVATRDINPGEIIMAQKPYIKVVHPSDSLNYGVCWHCSRQSWSGIPCENCNSIIYCSEICRDIAKVEHHNIECAVIAWMLAFGAHSGFFAVLRLLVKAHKEAGGCMETLRKNLEKVDAETDPLTRGFTNGKLDPNKFESFYSLKSHPHYTQDDKIAYLFYSILVTYLLAERTEFFGKKIVGNLNHFQYDRNFIFIIAFLEKIINLSNINSNARGFNGDNNIKMFETVTPCFNLFNHSCADEMAIGRFRGDYMTCVSLFPIKKGEQIFVNYGMFHRETPKKERQTLLLKTYRFICTCRACEEDWPTTLALLNREKGNVKYPKALRTEFIKISKKFERAKQFHDSYGLKHNQIPDVTEQLTSIAKLVTKFYYQYGPNSTEVFEAVNLLEKFIRLHDNRFLSPGPTKATLYP